MIVFLILAMFIVIWLTPIIILKALRKETVSFEMLFFNAIAITLLVIHYYGKYLF